MADETIKDIERLAKELPSAIPGMVKKVSDAFGIPDETITESEIWADLDAQYLMDARQPGDIDIPQFAARYGISLVTASRRMHEMELKGGYQIITVQDESSPSGTRKVLRKVR